MVKTSFSTSWKKSIQPRKQRKYQHNAPLHVKQKMVHVHLSSELRQKHGTRNVQVKKGDKIRVLVGKFKKKEGKIEKVNLKNGKVFVTGLENIKKDGTKVLVAFVPSNLMIVALNQDDKKRKIGLKKEKQEKKTTTDNDVKKTKKESGAKK
ncbi:MAG: 50S ribosomal protein L24 [Nanoarchaeota archaeon]|nr:50S ribosomal protein L24 [Nanoarchaeota archaeon]MBU1632765.1 50S ribosomal protein L24 [Nanoarchaeota archaeon]MBU1876395.1 50S ribosomal protein L24 [Nanoarchaeota archaeon]